MTATTIKHYSTVVVLMVLSAVVTLGQQEETCYADKKNPYVLFGAKTAYDFVRGINQLKPVASCKPAQVWLIIRHGTRYPKAVDIAKLKNLDGIRSEIIKNHEQGGEGKLCSKDLENLRTWTFDWVEDDGYTLTSQGYKELFTFAIRIKAAFPEALNLLYSDDKFKFRHTYAERTHASCIAFIQGLFGEDAGSVHVSPPIHNDPLIHGYTNCSAWNHAKKTELNREMKLYEESTLMRNLIYNISQRLGYSYNLSAENITNIYNLCCYTKARFVSSLSPWCAALTTPELQILEYAADLEYYYETGYGSDMNLKLGCPLVRDMIEKFSKLENTTKGQPSGIFYFSHELQINMLSSRFGFNKDAQPPTHTNYNEMKNRKFRSSLILPFAANIMAVFYKCTSGEENRIVFYQNEKVVDYEGCDEGVCSWKYIKAKFTDVIKPDYCNTDFCPLSTDNKNKATSFHKSWWIITLVVPVLHNYISWTMQL